VAKVPDIELKFEVMQMSTIHACPPEGTSITPCCKLPPFELPRSDRLTLHPMLVTCRDFNEGRPAVESTLFVRKPVAVEAIQWRGDNYDAVERFVTGDARYELCLQGDVLLIKAMEGGPAGRLKHWVPLMDWIIRGPQGDFYPSCGPEAFSATYGALAEAIKPQSG
jgi:hypothetical protein